MKVLIVDDEKLIVKGIKFSLEQDGIETDCAYDGNEALMLAKQNDYDIILLDIMLPELDGFEVCRAVREFSDVPVIMLTAKTDDTDKITGLDCGADDYIEKPFNILEVKARIKAILRRSGSKVRGGADGGNKKLLVAGDIRLETDGRRTYINNREIALTSKEFDLMVLFVTNPEKVFSREALLKIIWGTDYPGDGRTVDVHVRRLREKIEENPSAPKHVHTKWGVGYYFVV